MHGAAVSTCCKGITKSVAIIKNIPPTDLVVKRVISSDNESLPFSRLKANPKSLVHPLMAGNIKEASRGAVAGPRLGANKVMC